MRFTAVPNLRTHHEEKFLYVIPRAFYATGGDVMTIHGRGFLDLPGRYTCRLDQLRPVQDVAGKTQITAQCRFLNEERVLCVLPLWHSVL